MTAAGKEPRAARMARRMDGRKLGRYRIALAEVRPFKGRAGWFHVRLDLADPDGAALKGPLMTGIISGGGRGAMPWVECRLFPKLETRDGGAIDVRSLGLEAKMIGVLGDLIPPGGHLMIDYESTGQEETFAELVLRVPPLASYLGSLMYAAGFRGRFKDWYFSEGGHEGPRKLQANKSPDARAERLALREHRRELAEFIRRPLPARPADAEVVLRAQMRARAILKTMRA
jgi:hypothetical protein